MELLENARINDRTTKRVQLMSLMQDELKETEFADVSSYSNFKSPKALGQ